MSTSSEEAHHSLRFDVCHVRDLIARQFLAGFARSVGLLPEAKGDRKWIHALNLPPLAFIGGTVQGTMMDAAKWDGEFVTDFAAERPRLREAQMVGISRFASAD